MLHFLDKSAASAASPLYKACMGIFIINLLIACTALVEGFRDLNPTYDAIISFFKMVNILDLIFVLG